MKKTTDKVFKVFKVSKVFKVFKMRSSKVMGAVVRHVQKRAKSVGENVIKLRKAVRETEAEAAEVCT